MRLVPKGVGVRVPSASPFNFGEKMKALIALGVFITFVASWLTHIIVCLKTASWGFLIAGAICFPIAIVHGIGSWFGAF